MRTIMQYKPLNEIVICKLKDLTQVKIRNDFFSLTKADGEITLICLDIDVPKNAISQEGGFTVIYPKADDSFSRFAAMADITDCLDKNGIIYYLVSTFSKDYILLRIEEIDLAFGHLAQAGYKSDPMGQGF